MRNSSGGRCMNGLIGRLSGIKIIVLLSLILTATAGCSLVKSVNSLLHPVPDAPATNKLAKNFNYLIGPGDTLGIFVWRNPDLSTSVPVRPDGKITIPLVEDLQASGRTTTQLAREIEKALAQYIREPLVTVTVNGFVGEYYQEVRVVGQATKPSALPYKKNMTVLDLMVAVGGLTDYADGNKATLVRVVDGKEKEFRVRLDDLIRDGDISANVALAPGDILIIPEAWF